MKHNILVTGSHRSGSTWTGKVIAKSKKVRYVHEPFNIEIDRQNSPFTYWFEHLNGSSSSEQQKAKRYLNSFYSVFHTQNFKKIFKIRSARDVYHFLVDMKRRTTERTIIKDPIAIMSAEWIYENYNWDIVVLIRHPAAFVASLKVKDWQYDFNNYLDQTSLMDNYLHDYSDLIEEYSKNEKDIVDQGILLWNTIYEVVFHYKEGYKNDWYFVKHEDLSKNPLAEFEKMFSRLNLSFDNSVKDFINESTTANERSNLKRDSAKNINTWKSRLSREEIDRIKEGTKHVWPKFYTENDW